MTSDPLEPFRIGHPAPPRQLRMEPLEDRVVLNGDSVPSPTHLLFDAGDSYRIGQEQVHLLRRTDEIAVLFKSDAAAQALTAPEQPLAQFETTVKAIDVTTFSDPTVVVDCNDATAAFDQQSATLRAIRQSGGVDWASPVFEIASSHAWLIPNNEIVVSLKPGTTAQSFFEGDDRFVTYRNLWGTTDQFVATARGLGGEVLQISDALQSDSRLNWATPNFHREWSLFPSPDHQPAGDAEQTGNTARCGRAIQAAYEPFVESLYQNVLNRRADPTEVAGWADALANGASRRDVAKGFLESAEHRQRQVEELYSKFLSRTPDPEGRAGFTQALLAGAQVDDVLVCIVSSDEFKGVTPNDGAFVDALYQKLLQRPADEWGRANWMSALSSGASRAAVANAFVDSSEYHVREVNEIYTTRLGRSIDEFGAAAASRIGQGTASIDGVTADVLGSEEAFRRALGADLSKYVHAVYRSVLGRDAEPEALAGAVAALQQGAASRADLAASLWKSPEHRQRQVEGLYRTLLGRAPDAEGLQAWTSALLKGVDIEDVRKAFLGSTEYATINPVPDGFVESLYVQVLGRMPDAEAATGYSTALATSHATRQQVVAAVVDSAEHHARVVDDLFARIGGGRGPARQRTDYLQGLNDRSLTTDAIAIAVLASDATFARRS